MKRACWHLGVFLELAHLPGAIAIIILGRLWMPGWLYGVIMTRILSLQVATLGCPLMPLVAWIKYRYRPSPDRYTGSFTHWLYRRFGRWIVFPIMIVTVGAATCCYHIYLPSA